MENINFLKITLEFQNFSVCTKMNSVSQSIFSHEFMSCLLTSCIKVLFQVSHQFPIKKLVLYKYKLIFLSSVLFYFVLTMHCSFKGKTWDSTLKCSSTWNCSFMSLETYNGYIIANNSD